MSRPKAGSPRRPKLPNPSESQEQQVFFARVRLHPRTKHLAIFHIPNGGKRHVVTAMKLKREGVCAGVPDIFVAAPRREYAGLFIELKKLSGAKPTDAQRDMHSKLMQAGYCVQTCYGAEPAWITLCHYLGIAP